MFIAASTGSYADLSFENACTKIADLEFDRIELTLNESDSDWKLSEIAADPETAVIRCRDASRLSICAINIISDVDRQLFDGIAKFAKLLKVTQVTIPSLEIGTPFNDETDRLKDLVSIATQEGIRVSLKTQIGRLTEDPHTAKELCQSVKGLGLTLDPSHFTTGPHRDVDFDMVCEYTTHVHFRDSSPEKLQVPVGLGEMDYNRIITQLARYDYNRALSVDLIPELVEADADRDLEMRKMRMLLETLL